MTARFVASLCNVLEQAAWVHVDMGNTADEFGSATLPGYCTRSIAEEQSQPRINLPLGLLLDERWASFAREALSNWE